MRCMIWYHLQNLKNVENTPGGELLLLKFRTSQIAQMVPNPQNLLNINWNSYAPFQWKSGTLKIWSKDQFLYALINNF